MERFFFFSFFVSVPQWYHPVLSVTVKASIFTHMAGRLCKRKVKQQVYIQPKDSQDLISVSAYLSPQIIGRVSADPDYLPRTNDFGLNVAGFLQQYYPPECPSAFLPLAVICCDTDTDKRYDCSTLQHIELLLLRILTLKILFFHSFSTSFSKLEEWLENLLMHLDIGLPLLSELEQLLRAFWQSHNPQIHFDKPDKSLVSHEPTKSQRQGPDRGHSDDSNKHAGPNRLTQKQGQNCMTESSLKGQQHVHDNPDTRTETNHLSKECNKHSPEQNQTRCRSVSTDSDANWPCEQHNCSGLPQQEVSQTLFGQSSSSRRTCKVLWDRTTENSSVL